MTAGNLPLAARNVSRVVWNRAAKLFRTLRRRGERARKHARESAKGLRADARGAVVAARDGGIRVYGSTVKTTRDVRRAGNRVVPRLALEMSVRRELRRAARGAAPIIVGPWLSEVGYEVLYWVPFVRWFVDRYRVDPARLVVVSRGGVAGWYDGLCGRYIEILDLFTPGEFAARNAERQSSGDQKQHVVAGFDAEILARVRAHDGLAETAACHPSTMFRLLKQFWLGNESLEYLLAHTRYAPVSPPPIEVPDLPSSFVAMKFYTGKALPDSDANRRALRSLVERVAARQPVVLLDTGLALDEHEDYLFHRVPGVLSLANRMTPRTNLAVQTEIVRRASRFVGTCGGLAWLAPLLGTETLAVYADDHLLTSHLYAARHAYASVGAARFTPLDVHAAAALGLADDVPELRIDA